MSVEWQLKGPEHGPLQPAHCIVDYIAYYAVY
jgi:hypothetical protein